MQRTVIALTALATSLAVAPSAFAASDYFLKIEGIEGEASSSVEVLSWSWGASNASTQGGGGHEAHRVVSPRDPATGQSTGKRMHKPTVQASQNTQALRESPTRASTGRTDLMAAAAHDSVEAFSFTYDKASPVLAKFCATGTHIPKATITGAKGSFELENVVVTSCTAGQPAIAENQRAADGSMPNRISMNVTTPKQTQGATFGEKVSGGMQAAGSMTMTITGQMKHTKTGHVTLLK